MPFRFCILQKLYYFLWDKWGLHVIWKCFMAIYCRYFYLCFILLCCPPIFVYVPQDDKSSIFSILFSYFLFLFFSCLFFSLFLLIFLIWDRIFLQFIFCIAKLLNIFLCRFWAFFFFNSLSLMF